MNFGEGWKGGKVKGFFPLAPSFLPPCPLKGGKSRKGRRAEKDKKALKA